MASGERKPKCETGNSKFGQFPLRVARKIENLMLERGAPTHPRVFFARVANKGVRVDASRKSGKCET